MATRAGIQEGFGKAAERTLHKWAGLRPRASTVERVTEGAGARLAAALEAGQVFGGAAPWDWHADAGGQRGAYVSVDATGVVMQGPAGGKADGRMVYVGMIYNPPPRQADAEALAKPCAGARYLAGLYTLGELGLRLRRQGAQVGMNAAGQWIALTGGGSGLEEFIDVDFPRAAKALDFQHVAGHVAPFAERSREGSGAEQRTAAWCHTLEHAGGKQLIRVPERLDRKQMPESVRQEQGKPLSCLRKDEQGMDYPG